jgi:hypothetical protein
MIDATRIKAGVDLLALIGQDVQLRHVAGTHGGEYAGPCPFCGGRDRFRVWPEQGRYWCRGCEKAGDAISYLMERDHIDFREACSRLSGQVIDNEKTCSRQLTPRPRLDPETVSPEWKAAAWGIVAEAEALLWTDAGTRARAWLNARGLKDDTLKAWRIGYSPCRETRRGKDGELERGRWEGKLWICEGITIPTLAVDGDLWGVNVRRPVPDKERRYRAVAGSKKAAMYGRLAGKEELLLTEGEFDCLLGWQEAGDLVDVATFGSATVQPGAYWLPYLLGFRRLLLAHDTDTAGGDGAEKWSWTARAERTIPPLEEGQGKDITDFWKAGGNVRGWILDDLYGHLAAAAMDAEERGDVAEVGRLSARVQTLRGEVRV